MWSCLPQEMLPNPLDGVDINQVSSGILCLQNRMEEARPGVKEVTSRTEAVVPVFPVSERRTCRAHLATQLPEGFL